MGIWDIVVTIAIALPFLVVTIAAIVAVIRDVKNHTDLW